MLLALGCAACRATNSQMYTSFGAPEHDWRQKSIFCVKERVFSIKTNFWRKSSTFSRSERFFGVKNRMGTFGCRLCGMPRNQEPDVYHFGTPLIPPWTHSNRTNLSRGLEITRLTDVYHFG